MQKLYALLTRLIKLNLTLEKGPTSPYANATLLRANPIQPCAKSTLPCANTRLKTEGKFWEINEALLPSVRSVERKGLNSQDIKMLFQRMYGK